MLVIVLNHQYRQQYYHIFHRYLLLVVCSNSILAQNDEKINMHPLTALKRQYQRSACVSKSQVFSVIQFQKGMQSLRRTP